MISAQDRLWKPATIPQYDNQDVYQEAVYRFHHECYLSLLLAFDQLRLPPLNFSNVVFSPGRETGRLHTQGKAPEEFGIFQKALDMGKDAAKELWGLIESWNDSLPQSISKALMTKSWRPYLKNCSVFFGAARMLL